MHRRNVFCVAASLILCPVFGAGAGADADPAGPAEKKSFASDRDPIVVTDEAIRIHKAAPVFDGHNDLPWALRKSGSAVGKIDLRKNQLDLHTDIPRLRRGGVGAQFLVGVCARFYCNTKQCSYGDT